MNLIELIKDIKQKFITTELNNNYNSTNLVIYEYTKPIYGIGVKDQFGQVGKYDDLLKAYNMTPEDIKELVKNIL